MRTSPIAFLAHIAACSLLAAGIPELFLPKGVMFGTTQEDVLAACPGAFKPEIATPVLRVTRAQLATGENHGHANITVLMETTASTDSIAIHTYHFLDQKLA